MSRMKLIAILVVMAIPFSIGEYASAASTMTKTIEYSADRAEEKQDVSKVVEQDGKKWKLKKVDYKIIKKDPVMTKKKVIKTVKSTPVPDGKEYSPKESVEISGVTYQLQKKEKESRVILQQGYTVKFSGYTDYNSFAKSLAAPKTKKISAVDKNGKTVSKVCKKTKTTDLGAFTEQTRINIRIISYNAKTLRWNGHNVANNKDDPLKGYENELLKSTFGTTKGYTVKTIRWSGKPYEDKNGRICRNAVASIAHQTHHYRVNYTGQRVIKKKMATVYKATYIGEEEVESGDYTYTIQANAQYQAQKNNIILLAAGVVLVVGAFVGSLFLLYLKKTNNRKEES